MVGTNNGDVCIKTAFCRVRTQSEAALFVLLAVELFTVKFEPGI